MLEQALALHRQGRLPEAEKAYRAILARDPSNAEVGHLLGTLALDAGLPQAAVPILEHVVTLQPANPAFHVSLGTSYAQAGHPADALRSFDQALTLDDAFFPAHFQRGIALMEPDPEAALTALGRAIALQPDSAPADNYRAIVLTHLGRFDEAFESFSRALELARDNPMAHSNCGAALVRLGRHADALPHLEAAVALAPDNGELHYNLAGPLMALDRLDEALAFGTRPDSVPAATPYLHAEPALVEKWRQRIGADGFKIGICWRGSNNADMGIDRSFPLKALAPLAAIPGVRLISLQQVDGLDQLPKLPPGMTVETLGDDFDSGSDAFVDTAAAIQSLDLVISCDTSVAHLAGALGRPCWTALKHLPEWRWTLHEKTTPWYPGMSLFRQDAPGDWASVFAAMAGKLKAQQA